MTVVALKAALEKKSILCEEFIIYNDIKHYAYFYIWLSFSFLYSLLDSWSSDLFSHHISLFHYPSGSSQNSGKAKGGVRCSDKPKETRSGSLASSSYKMFTYTGRTSTDVIFRPSKKTLLECWLSQIIL